MWRDYVTKGLQFLQKPSKAAPKQEETEKPVPAAESELLSGTAEAPSIPEAPPSPQSEEAPAPNWAGDRDGDPFAEPQPPERTPGQDDYETGIRAYQEKRTEEALSALIRAAELGHMEAQFLCGHMYQHGIAAEQNVKTALAWYKRAAKQGFLRAQMACAAMYEEGAGTEIDLKRALSWYEQAAKQGDVSAQLKCGRMYHSGRAETRSPKKARYWLEIAAGNGSEEAKQLLQDRF